MKKTVLYFLLTLFATNYTIKSQITIGSSEKPLEGSLLQLQEFANSSVDGKNSNKGLLLPRVALTPSADLASTLGAPSGTYNHSDHAGLTVYNLSDNSQFCKGVYLWTGENWERIPKKEVMPDITVHDTDGNPYTAKWFSLGGKCDPTQETGAYWMTSNLRTTLTPDSTAIINQSTIDNLRLINPSSSNSFMFTNKQGLTSLPPISFGQNNSNPLNIFNQILSANEFASKFGILYTWEQATIACPTGWRLPNKSDWDLLLQSLGGQATAGAKMRANRDYYRSYNQIISLATLQWGEKDPKTHPSEFNALPTGYLNSGGGYFKAFAETTAWWNSQEKGSYVELKYNSPSVSFAKLVNEDRRSVRCVKIKD